MCIPRVIGAFLVFSLCFVFFDNFSEATTNSSSKYDPLKRFSQVLDLVERNYVKEMPRKEIVDGAIKGMLQSLDPHSTFLNPEDFKEIQETTSGEFFGIGIEIANENGQLTVISPIEDTPADKAGLKSGDLIVAVDGKPTLDLSAQDAVTLIRGAKGTEVELTILSKSATAPKTVKIKRDAIPLISVKMREFEPDYYWLRITRFSEKTTSELTEALNDIKKKSEVKGIVLDLRNNPGGLLEQSINVADMFLRDGIIVSIKGRVDNINREYKARAQAGDIIEPMVVLINAGSASAAEILAGALGDQNRAILLGERSFGKGSVQNVIPLADGSGLKLTIALYYTPNGRSIQAEGIVPDIEIPFESIQATSDKGTKVLLQIREQDLSKHIETKDNGQKSKPKTEKEKKEAEEVEKFLGKDNQLRLALQIVKGLPRFKTVQ